MKDILSEIIANKRFEVDLQKQAISIEQLQEGISESPTPRSMKQALASSTSGIIAEFKRRSPSKGWIQEEARPEEIVPSYAAAGASALSILTDEKFFGGSLKDIRAARPLVEIPILRKDFIIDEYQLYQAKIVGADAVLLIAAALEPEKCNELAEKAHELGLEVLLEIHSSEELAYINKGIDMVGINNRNLGTFFTDVENSFRLAGQLPQDSVLVSESGISDPEIVKRLRAAGFRGFLIGETFMKTQRPGETLQNFLHADRFGLNDVQLHGNESPEYCRSLHSTGLKIIKAFSVDRPKDLKKVYDYEKVCDLFLFDTKCEQYGGSGNQFDWSILHTYNGDVPFLLSGGINSYSANALKEFKHPRLAGYDLNSRFETKPGEKDPERIRTFLNELKSSL